MYSTAVVDEPNKKSGPNSTVYLVANYLGQGNNSGTLVGFYGKYTDLWTKERGEWKSKARTLTFFVSDLGRGRYMLKVGS